KLRCCHRSHLNDHRTGCRRLRDLVGPKPKQSKHLKLSTGVWSNINNQQWACYKHQGVAYHLMKSVGRKEVLMGRGHHSRKHSDTILWGKVQAKLGNLAS